MKTVLAIILILAALASSGCAAIIAAQLKNKIPRIQAAELTVTVNVAGVGGGTAQVKGQKFDAAGNLTLDELHETIATAGGSVKIDGTGIVVPASGAASPSVPVPTSP